MKQITLAELPEIVQHLINQTLKTGGLLTITENSIAFATIFPIRKKSLLQTLSTLEPLDEDFADVDEGLLLLNTPSYAARRAILRSNSR